MNRLTLAIALAFASFTATAGTVYVPQSASYRRCTWKYWKGTAEPPANWPDAKFDDTAWLAGMAPFGHDVRGYVRYGTELADMRGHYSTLFLRKRFFVDDLSQTGALKLSVNYGGGFVAWLNGVKVAGRNAPARPAASAVATAEHPPNEFHLYEVIPIPEKNIPPKTAR